MQNPGAWTKQNSSLMAKKPQAEFLSLTPIRSKLGIPSSPRPSLRVSALRRQRARRGGGTGGLGHGHLVVEAAGPQGRERHHGLFPRPQQWPLGVRGSAGLV
jgi:hypothetical protein